MTKINYIIYYKEKRYIEYSNCDTLKDLKFCLGHAKRLFSQVKFKVIKRVTKVTEKEIKIK